MPAKQNTRLTRCNYTINYIWGVRPILFSLALTSALVSPAIANTTNPEINAEYLNQLSGPKIVWNESSANDASAILINGKYYKYTYHRPDDYNETNTQLNNELNENNTNKMVFKDIIDTNAIYTHPDKPESTSAIQIKSDFINNKGAIENRGMYGRINSIIGDFIGNHSGAIYNFEADIDNINGNFIGNYRQNSYARGGAIVNTYRSTIDNITGNFIGNYVRTIGSSGSAEAEGGAIYSNVYSIGNITGDFIGNYALSETGYARGGAIYNGDYLYLTNSSFYNNYAKGKTSLGGAIFQNYWRWDGDEIIPTLFITADNGNSIFSGNYIETINDDGTTTKESNAITSHYGHIYFNATNNGLIRFDDKITILSKSTIEELEDTGRVIVKDDNGNYVLSDGYMTYTSYKTQFGDFISFESEVIPPEELDMLPVIIEDFKTKGFTVTETNNQYKSKDYYIDYYGEGMLLTQQSDGSYLVGMGYILSDKAKALIISGDASSQVIFNEAINTNGTIDISGTNVFANKGFFSNINIHDNGKLNIGANTIIEDSMVTGGSNLKIAPKAIANRITVGDGGVLSVDTSGEANDTTVNSGGTLKAVIAARINNLLANDGAKLLVDKDAVMTGNIIINAGAIMGGSYDYSKIFKTEAIEQGSLTLVGGLNEAMDQNSLENEVANKKLNLTSGQYVVGSEQSSVKGWDKLTVSDATVKLAGNIEMANASKTVNIASDSVLDLAGNSPLVATITGSLNNDGVLNFHHDTDGADDITNVYGNYTAFNNARMIIDVDLTNKVADQLLVDGDVSGTTKVTLYPLSDEQTKDLIKFVNAPNDDTSTGAYFTIDRVYRQALDIRDQWKIVYKDNAWHVTSVITDTADLTNGYGSTDNGDLDVDLAEDAVLPSNFPNAPTIVPTTPTQKPVSEAKAFAETIAYMSLPTIGLEQIRDLNKIVTNKVASTKYKCTNCGIYDHIYNATSLNNAWIDLKHHKAEIDTPAEIEAKIKAVDIGFDIQSTPYNRLGLFASYRKGDYDLNGKGKNYYSTTGSELDIDSWGLGLYHRYDYKQLWTMSSIFGGIQEVDLMTDDGISSKTDGIMFGANVEAGIMFEPQKRLTLEPSIRLGYNFIKYDDMSDAYGKTAKFDNISNIEAEAGVKIEKSWMFGYRDIAKLFVKPSIIQNIGNGDVNITSIDSVKGVENQTLIRGEAGISIVGNNGFNGFATIGHSFGCDYKSTDFNLGVGYSW